MILDKKMKIDPKEIDEDDSSSSPKEKAPLELLPSDCLARIVCMIYPLSLQEVCTFGMTSKPIRDVTDSDAVWGRFLPIDCDHLISRARNFHVATLQTMRKKDLYMHLCDNFIVIDDDHLSFKLDKRTGKKTFVIGRKRFRYSDNESYDGVDSDVPEASRYYHRNESVFTLYRIGANMEPNILSPRTLYKAFMVFKVGRRSSEYTISKLSLSFKAVGEPYVWSEDDFRPTLIYLRPRWNEPLEFFVRPDGSMEAEIDEFFNFNGKNLAPLMCILDEFLWTVNRASGVMLMGIEIRPVR